jgi:hypothetical protein
LDAKIDREKKGADMEVEPIYAIAGAALALALTTGGTIAYFIVKAGRERQRELFEKFAHRLGAEIGTSLFEGVYLKGREDGIGYRIFIVAGNQYSPPDLRIEFGDRLPYILTIQEKGLNSRLENAVGFGRGETIESGVEEMDEKFSIRTSDPERAKRYLTDPEVSGAFSRISRKAQIRFRGDYAEIIIPLDSKKGSLQMVHASENIDFDEVEYLLREGISLLGKMRE